MCLGAPWARGVQRVPPLPRRASPPGLGSESSHGDSWAMVSWVAGGEPSSSECPVLPRPVPQGWTHLSLGHLAETGLHGGTQGGGRADRSMPPGTLGPNTCRKDQSSRWTASALLLCAPLPSAHHNTTMPATIPHWAPTVSGGIKGQSLGHVFLQEESGPYNVSGD